MGATIKIPTVFTAIDKVSSVVKNISKGVGDFGKSTVASVNRFDRKLTSSFRKMSNLSQLALGLGIGSIFTLAIQNNIAYEDSLASVSAITGAVGDDLVLLEKRSKLTAKSQKQLGANVLKAYELVGSAQPELLNNIDALDGVTNSVITLSKASRLDLTSSAGALTDVMNQFNKKGKDSIQVVDALASGAKFGAAAIPQISEAIIKFGTTASLANVSLIESVSAVELFASKGLKGAEAGTKMNSVLTTLSVAKSLPPSAGKQLEKFGVNLDIVTNKALPLSDRLKEMSKIGGDATAMFKVFGKENQGAAGILLNNIGAFDKLNEQIGGPGGIGVAMEQAKKNTYTFKFALESIKNSFLNATTATQSNNKFLDLLKDTLFIVANNIDIVVGALVGLGVAFGLMKTIVIGTKIATIGYNVVLGIQGALYGGMTKKIASNSVALGAYKVAQVSGTAVTWLATAATTAFAVALNLGLFPITLIGLAIVAVILIFNNWGAVVDWFSAKFPKFTKFISDAWGSLVAYFQDFNFEQFFIDIGDFIVNGLLMPLKTLLFIVSKIPGDLGNLAGEGLAKLNELSDFSGSVDVKSDGLPSTTQASNAVTTEAISTVKNKIDLNINDPGGKVGSVESDSNDINILSTSTFYL